MTEADALFIKAVSMGIKPSEAYIQCYGDIEGNVGIKARKLIKGNEEINKGIKELLAGQGITLRKLNATLGKQLKATKAIAVSKDSHIEYVPDNQAIDNALTTGYKLYGVLKEKDIVIDQRQVTFTGDPAELLKVIQEMKQVDAKAIDISGEVV